MQWCYGLILVMLLSSSLATSYMLICVMDMNGLGCLLRLLKLINYCQGGPASLLLYTWSELMHPSSLVLLYMPALMLVMGRKVQGRPSSYRASVLACTTSPDCSNV